jgi:hypothetical protein
MMITTKTKGALSTSAPFKTPRSYSTNFLGYRIWVWTYSMEEVRQRYSDSRQLLKQAAACVALSLLRKVG